MGHFHRWLAVTPDGPCRLARRKPDSIDPDIRYLVVVAAVCNGWCAIYDTETDVLTPLQFDRASDGRRRLPGPGWIDQRDLRQPGRRGPRSATTERPPD